MTASTPSYTIGSSPVGLGGILTVMSFLLFVYIIPVAGHHTIHQASMKSHRYDSFWNEIFGDIIKTNTAQ